MGVPALVLTAALLTVLAPPPSAPPAQEAAMHDLSGFAVAHLPEGTGEQVTDFHTEWEDVAFASRVWERPLPEGGYSVDLKVNVMRGERLTDLAAVRAFLTDYHERDPADWPLTAFQHGGDPGLHGGGLAFWSDEPGVAVEVRLDPHRFPESELMATALGIQRTD
ncbi:hypothetical protein LG943_00515 [Streptomonospora sp. S1-112]|uniref:Uncharacterized protein n=1 Tax=Streptomonospora mangrovi TaxID=2883123 RepID=A0A9X3SFC7_9ACTN|nr:hypothetical protein [Streptomonospora mangrovi]MDA0562829.1 hypothetical protein [Streptomonospora mangrovi]